MKNVIAKIQNAYVVATITAIPGDKEHKRLSYITDGYIKSVRVKTKSPAIIASTDKKVGARVTTRDLNTSSTPKPPKTKTPKTTNKGNLVHRFIKIVKARRTKEDPKNTYKFTATKYEVLSHLVELGFADYKDTTSLPKARRYKGVLAIKATASDTIKGTINITIEFGDKENVLTYTCSK